MGDLSTINDDVFNLVLFKKIGFYQMFDPSSRKIYNFNVYQLMLIVYIFVEEFILIYGLLTYYIVGMEDNIDFSANMLSVSAYMMNVMSLVQTLGFMYKSNEIWELFNVARYNFLTSKHCHKKYDIRSRYGKLATQISNYFSVSLLFSALYYFSLPIVLKYVISYVNVNEDNTTTKHRLENIYNYRFPVTVETHNKYYLLFYIIELADMLMILLIHGYFNNFIVIFGLAFVALYEINAEAFANIGYDEQVTQTDNEPCSVPYLCDDYKQIMIDRQKLHLKLKSFYSIIWLGIYSSIALLSFEIIILSFTVVLTIFSTEKASAAEIFKLSDPFLLYCLELYCYCYLMETINTKKELGLYGMYSSNWTGMYLKTKKNLLLLMMMENANKLILKLSPYKIVNIQLFASVMKISYNIVSVMAKTHYK